MTRCLLPFLKIGVILALVQSVGSTPSANDLLNKAANGAASCSAPSFKSRGQMPSGPQALPVFSEESSENTSEGVTDNWSKVKPEPNEGIFGKQERSSLVKTETK